MHACQRHDLARLANTRRGVQAAEEARALTTGRLGEMLSSQAATLEQLEEEACLLYTSDAADDM
eukprot:12685341-Alexandrium_andersonii.AAC.1